jgi:outer membrane protein assembly complex protein YaeT
VIICGPRIARTCLLLLATLTVSSLTAGCHEAGDVRVMSLSFEGVQAFDPGQLKRILATRQSGWLPWSPKQYFDRREFDDDLKRIVAFYADRGFPDARVDGVDVTFNEKKDGVSLRIRVHEGEPVIVEHVRFEGFQDLPERAQRRLQAVPLQAGARRDRDVVRATREQVARLYRNNGHPLVAIDATERPGASERSVIVSYFADPGPAMTFGPASVAGTEKLSETVITRELAFKPGQPYDERLVSQTQRRLSGLELLEFATVTPRTDAPEGASVPVRVTVAEGPPRRLRLGVGYGSEELARVAGSWQHLNFLGGGKQLSADAKWSSIDRGVHFGVLAPYVKRPGLSLSITTEAWSSEQLTYDSETYGGRVTLAYRFDRPGRTREPVRYRVSGGLVHSFLRYGIAPDSLDDQSRRLERIALGLDPDTGRGSGTIGSWELDFDRTAVDLPASPRRGTKTSIHFEMASEGMAGTYRFTELGVDVRGFVPAGPTVLAGRLRVAGIRASTPTSMPFSRRYFLGGSTSLRGWGRYEVSPLDPDGLPVGGRALIEMSSELRLPVRRALSTVLFVDGGYVWHDPANFNLRDLVWDTGVGVRYLSPVGAIGADIGWQLTPIEGLVVNGVLTERRWRLHFNIGHSF